MITNKDAGEFLRDLAPASVDLVLTSPPYWCQRTYGSDSRELGVEPVVTEYITRLADILHGAWSCVRPTGWVAVNIADTYANQPGQYRHSDKSGVSASNRAKAGSAPMRSLAGLPLKTQAGVPERLKIAMIDRGWRCRNTIIWHKTSPLPTTATDRWNLSYEVVHVFARSVKSHFSRTELGDAGKGYDTPLRAYMQALAARLRDVRITCGDWARVVTPSAIRATCAGDGSVGILFDPPYTTGADVYGHVDADVSHAVRGWCRTANASLRIVLCGFEDDHDELLAQGWRKVQGKAGSGSGYSTDVKAHKRERLWLSPACLGAQMELGL